MELLTLKKMGLSKPQVARGIDPHVPYRQSTMTIDGPSIDRPAYSHEPVILDYIEGFPAFKAMLQGIAVPAVTTGIASLCTQMVAYVADRGGALTTYIEGANEAVVIAEFFTWIRQRLYLIWNGAEQEEMPIIKELLEHNMDSAFDAGLKLADLYLTGLLLPDVPATEVDELTDGGFFGFAVDMSTSSTTSGSVTLAAAGLPTGAGEEFEGWQFFPVVGTTVVDSYVKELEGEDAIFIDIVV